MSFLSPWLLAASQADTAGLLRRPASVRCASSWEPDGEPSSADKEPHRTSRSVRFPLATRHSATVSHNERLREPRSHRGGQRFRCTQLTKSAATLRAWPPSSFSLLGLLVPGQWSERRESQCVARQGARSHTSPTPESSIGLYRRDQASHGLYGPWRGPASWPGMAIR